MKKKLAILLSIIDKEWQSLEKMVDKLKIKSQNINIKNENEEDVIFIAYNIHNIYCCLEDIFKQIAKTFENNIENLSTYHSELLKKMNLEIFKIRPKFLSDNNYEILNEIRKFRHIFRHAYEYELKKDKIVNLLKIFLNNWDNLIRDKDDFKKFLLSNL